MIDETDFVEPCEIEISHSTHYTYLDDAYSHGTISSTGWLAGTTQTFKKYEYYSYSSFNSYHFLDRFQIRNESESLFPIGYDYTLTLSGLLNSSLWAQASNTSNNGYLYFDGGGVKKYRVYAYDASGNWQELHEASVTVSDDNQGSYTITVNTGSLPFEVFQLDVDIIWEYQSAYGDNNTEYSSGKWLYSRTLGFDDFNIAWVGYSESTSAQKELVELNKGILETVKGIATSIVELPTTIWDKFQAGLMALFVPSEQFIDEMNTAWQNFFMEHFGAFYEVIAIISEYVGSFVESEQSTVFLPEITVPVGADGFTFGGWEVQVVPDGMSVLFEALKMIVSIVATFFFINGLKRRFEGVLGGEPMA